MSERKTSLTPEEKITAAFMHYVRKVDMQDIAMLYGVNIGRVSEACSMIDRAVGPVDPARLNTVRAIPGIGMGGK